MNRRLIPAFALLVLVPALATAQRPDPRAAQDAQRAALRKLPAMDGTWRGTARIMGTDGKWAEHIQTERVGPMLDSTLKVIEGRGYDAEGKKTFNAFAVIGWDLSKQAYSFRSYAQGSQGDFSFTPSDSGFVWEIPAGPTMTIRYTATVRDGRWREVGDRATTGQQPVRFIEMELARVGPTDWPAGGAMQAK